MDNKKFKKMSALTTKYFVVGVGKFRVLGIAPSQKELSSNPWLLLNECHASVFTVSRFG